MPCTVINTAFFAILSVLITVKIVARKNKVVRKLVAGVEIKMKQNNVTVICGNAFGDSRRT
jgi:pyruvate/2-oxoglutarate dehydrogenase complex dihydrolipoamide dehydrogenase (E3) component